MYNFFVDGEEKRGDAYFITGADFNHIKNVLRMKCGERFLVSDNGISHLCELESITPDTAVAKVIEENYKNSELPIRIYLFQGLPKSDKLELIIQKCVELGVYSIIPVEMKRSIVKLDEKKKSAKNERWRAIAESAAKQSKRSIIPEVENVMSYRDAMKRASELDVFLVPYENKDGMAATKEALKSIKRGATVGILIGPEGGFEEREIEEALACGGTAVSLGERILRTETAALTASAMCMLYAEMNLE